MKLTTKLLLGTILIAGLSISAFAACATDVDFGSTDGTNGKNITGLKDPANPQDAATKGYVDSRTPDLSTRVASRNDITLNNDANLTVNVGARSICYINDIHHADNFGKTAEFYVASSAIWMHGGNLTSGDALSPYVSFQTGGLIQLRTSASGVLQINNNPIYDGHKISIVCR